MNDLADFDMFFYYGQNDILDEIQSDINIMLAQPKRSLFYSRSYGAAGVQEYENAPNAVNIAVSVPYDIVKEISKRNSIVSNGQDGGPDRRVAISQNTIKIEQDKDTLNIKVLYIPFVSLGTPQVASVDIGGTK